MRYIDVCSGISAPTLAWKPLGWRALCFAEIDPAPRAVLAHHYPHVPLVGDFTALEGTEYGTVDLVVGGTPCQDFSVAGLREGLDGERGNLTLEFGRLARRSGAGWFVWENVPGVFSSNEGRDFGAVLANFAGYPAGTVFAPPRGGWRNSGVVAPAGPNSHGLAWRVLDAQHFGVPQRRRRVFVVGYIGDWRPAAAVLLERAGLSGHPSPGQEAREGTAAAADGGIVGSLCADTHPGAYTGQDAYSGRLIAHSLRAEGFDASEDGTGRATPLVPVHCFDAPQSDVLQYGDRAGPLDTDAFSQAICFSAKDHGADALADIAPTLRAGGHRSSHANAGVMPAVAFTQNSRSEVREIGGDGQVVGALAADAGAQQQNYLSIGGHQAVRRLTPRECERLQGFPDDFTLVRHRGKPMADGPRYKMCGNSMAVPVLGWIGRRIEAVEAILEARAAAA